MKTNGFAVASMVLGFVWVDGICSVLAVIFGYLGIALLVLFLIVVASTDAAVRRVWGP